MVPKKMQPIYDEFEYFYMKYCEKYLNAEYCLLCLHLVEKLCRKRPSPLLTGRLNTWAAAIVYVIGSNNFLFDRSQNPHMSGAEIASSFGLSKSTVANKAAEIRKMMRISQFDPEWTLPSMMEDNPYIWMVTMNGFVVDIRTMPREIQEQAYHQGIIPFIPGETTKPSEAAETHDVTQPSGATEPPEPSVEVTGGTSNDQPHSTVDSAAQKTADFSDIYEAFGVKQQ